MKRGNNRNMAGFDLANNGFNLCFIAQAVFGRIKSGELADIGASGKGFITCPCNDDSFDMISIIGRAGKGAKLGQFFIHAKGQRIACLRPVQGHMRNAIVNADKQFTINGRHIKFLLAIEQLDQEHWNGRNIGTDKKHPNQNSNKG